MIRLARLDRDPAAPFPPLETALREPDGLLAYGGGLEPERLLNAYRAGIFPWSMPGEPLLWWSPDPRAVFEVGTMHVPRRFARTLRASRWTVGFDRDFAAVVAGCAAPRADGPGTWITPELAAAFGQLHQRGHAHAVEVRDADDTLIGGLYGLAVGRVFCAESMFSARSGASRVALLALSRVLADIGYLLIDAQVVSPHLRTLGVRTLPRSRFAAVLAEPGDGDRPGSWRERFQLLPAAALAAVRP